MHAHSQHARLQREHELLHNTGPRLPRPCVREFVLEERTKTKPWRTCSGPVTADAAAVASAAEAAGGVRGAVTMRAALHRSQQAAARNACTCGPARVVRVAAFSPSPVAGHHKIATIPIISSFKARTRDLPPGPVPGWNRAARLQESAHMGRVLNRTRAPPTRGASNVRPGTSGCGNAAAIATRAHAEHPHSKEERARERSIPCCEPTNPLMNINLMNYACGILCIQRRLSGVAGHTPCLLPRDR